MLLILNLVKPNEKGGNAMASQILVTSNSEDRLNPMIPTSKKSLNQGGGGLRLQSFSHFSLW